jgi:hypothetical protein
MSPQAEAVGVNQFTIRDRGESANFSSCRLKFGVLGPLIGS